MNKTLSVTTIGGGNGCPVVNEALLRTGKVDYINVISAVFDSGGATGIRRTDARGKELAYSDPMRNLLSLIKPSKRGSLQYKALVALMTKRSWGKVLGQEVFAQLHTDGDGFDNIQCQLENLTGLKFMGKIIPPTTTSTNIVFSTVSGRIYTNESQLDTHAMSKDTVVDMWLEKSSDAYGQAKDAIEKATHIFLSCGSIHGSVLCNILPNGMKESFRKTRAKLYLVTNLVSNRNESHDFTPADFVHLIQRYTGIKPDGLIVPAISRKEFERRFADVAAVYDMDHSYFLGWEEKELQEFREKEKVQIITHNATAIIETSANEKTLRHDPIKLAKTLTKIL